MKKLFTIIYFLSSIFIYSQSYQIRLVNKGSGSIGVEIRETTGVGTPTTSYLVTDIKFGIKWSNLYNVDLGSPSGSYNIVKSGSRTVKGSFHFQSFGANPSSFNFPENYVQNSWVEIMSVTNDLSGTGLGEFIVCETGFDNSTDPNIGVFNGTSNSDYTPTISGTATDVPLPVELTTFIASVKNNDVILKWETATETNNFGFNVERKSLNSDNPWKKITFITGNGSSYIKNSYKYIDKYPTGGTKFQYRLKQIDLDGTSEYSSILDVSFSPEIYELEQNFPNPFNPSTTIRFSIPKQNRVKISVYDILGKLVQTIVDKDFHPGNHQVQFNGSRISSGIYIYTLETKDFIKSKKMLMLK